MVHHEKRRKSEGIFESNCQFIQHTNEINQLIYIYIYIKSTYLIMWESKIFCHVLYFLIFYLFIVYWVNCNRRYNIIVIHIIQLFFNLIIFLLQGTFISYKQLFFKMRNNYSSLKGGVRSQIATQTQKRQEVRMGSISPIQ